MIVNANILPIKTEGLESVMGSQISLTIESKILKKPEHNKKELKENRKHLRKNLTPAEAYLWKVLQGGKFEGRKFRRQQSINNFIVDFYCPSEQLIIELDGEVHLNALAEEKDRKREEELEKMGVTVLRFENKMVFENLDSVLKEIKDNFKVRE